MDNGAVYEQTTEPHDARARLCGAPRLDLPRLVLKALQLVSGAGAGDLGPRLCPARPSEAEGIPAGAGAALSLPRAGGVGGVVRRVLGREGCLSKLSVSLH